MECITAVAVLQHGPTADTCDGVGEPNAGADRFVEVLERMHSLTGVSKRSTEVGHHWFHVARAHDHSPLPSRPS